MKILVFLYVCSCIIRKHKPHEFTYTTWLNYFIKCLYLQNMWDFLIIFLSFFF